MGKFGVILTIFLIICICTAICFTACGDETVEKRTDDGISEINVVTWDDNVVTWDNFEEKEQLITEHILEENILVEETIH